MLISVRKSLLESQCQGGPKWSQVTDSSWPMGHAFFFLFFLFLHSFQASVDLQTVTMPPNLDVFSWCCTRLPPGEVVGRACSVSKQAANPQEAWVTLPTAGMGRRGGNGGCRTPPCRGLGQG